MVVPGSFVGEVSDSEAATELSLQMIETVQQTLKQKRQQLEDIRARQKSLAQEYAQLTATASDLAQQFSSVMKDLEGDNSPPVNLGAAGLGDNRKSKRWKATALLGLKSPKSRETKAA